jgi:predicted nucleic acid-binding protein
MSFWDSSALIPLCVRQPGSSLMERLHRVRSTSVVWWASLVECRSGLERERRSGSLTFEQKQQAQRLLDQLAESWMEVVPTAAVRERALRVLAVHELRAADALQLAAALTWAADRPAGRPFVCLDVRLRECAQREGFQVLPEEWPLPVQASP